MSSGFGFLGDLAMSYTVKPAHLSDPILRNMGLVTARWGVLEAHLEFLILRFQEIDLNTGLLLTANLSFRAKADLLLTFAAEKGFADDENSKLKTLVREAERLYGKRNMVAHSAWFPTDNPLVAKVRGIRTRGKLVVTDDEISANDLQAIADEIHALGADLLDFMDRNGIRPEDSFHYP